MRAYILTDRDFEKKKEIIQQIRNTFAKKGWITRVVNSDGHEGLTSSAILDFQKDACQMDDQEYGLIIPSQMVGPVADLEDLEENLKKRNASRVQLARRTGMIAFKKDSENIADIMKLILNNMDVDEIDSLIQEELFDTSSFRLLTDNPLLDYPGGLIQKCGFPFFSLDVFKREFSDAINTTLGNQTRLLLKVLRSLEYDLGPLFRYLLKTCEQIDLLYNLQLFYVLPSEYAVSDWEKTRHGEKFLALGMHLYYMDLLPQSRAYAERFPPETDIVITTSDERKKKEIEKAFEGINCNSLVVRVIENRGRDVSSLLVGMQDIFRWKYVCFFHDKKTLQTKPGSVGIGFAYQCAENLFSSKCYVQNIVHLFEENDKIGMLSPPPPNHADYYFTMELPWGNNWDVSFDLYKKLGLTVPISKDKSPVAPLGTCFWFRGEALRPLFEHGWEYEDFPPEPNGIDATILHAFERIYPYCVQEEGYFAGYVCSDKFAAMLRTTFMHYIRSYNTIAKEFGIVTKTTQTQLRIGEILRTTN